MGHKINLRNYFLHKLFYTPYNLATGKSKELKNLCQPLNEYSIFSNKYKDFRKQNLTIDESVREATHYCLENNITNENGEIKTGDITRNVWVVDVKHNKEAKPKDAEIETVKKLYNKKYYIDAATGEIIGGEQSEYFNN